jgi:hypothetical protein
MRPVFVAHWAKFLDANRQTRATQDYLRNAGREEALPAQILRGDEVE